MKWMINGLTDAEDYEKRLIENCIYVLSPPDRNAKRIDFKDAVKCAVALDKRQFAMEVLPAVMLDLTIFRTVYNIVPTRRGRDHRRDYLLEMSGSLNV